MKQRLKIFMTNSKGCVHWVLLQMYSFETLYIIHSVHTAPPLVARIHVQLKRAILISVKSSMTGKYVQALKYWQAGYTQTELRFVHVQPRVLKK